MNKKFFSKLLVVLILIVMVINNISLAVNIAKEDFEASINKFFGSKISIRTVASSNGFSSDVSTVYHGDDSEIVISDDKITLTERGEVNGEIKELVHIIDYEIKDNIITFKTESDLVKIMEDAEDETSGAWAVLGEIMLHSNYMMIAYLATADLQGIDPELAATYYNQVNSANKTVDDNEETGIYTEQTETPTYKYITVKDDNNGTVETEIEINIDEVGKIDESMLDGTVTVTLTFEGESDNDDSDNGNTNNTVNNTTSNNMVNNTVNNTVENKVNNTYNNISNTNVTNNTANNIVKNTTKNVVNNTKKDVDNTTSNKIIPAAGHESIYYIVISMVIISMIIYIKLRRYDDVK